MKKFFTNNYILFLFVIILCAFGILSLSSALHESLTFDEIVHIQEGENAWLHQTFAIDTNNPPLIREMQALPIILTSHFPFTSSKSPLLRALPARLITILLGEFLLIAVFFFAKNNFNKEIALFASFLLAFDPTILGNSHYVTQDIGTTFFFFLTYWQVWIFFKKQSIKNAAVLGLLIGLGLASKLTFLPYFFLSVILFLLYVYRNQVISHLWRKKNLIIFMCVISAVAIWATYFFKYAVVVQERSDANRISAKLLSYASASHNVFLKDTILFFEKQPIPLGDFIGMVKNNTLRNFYGGQCFFLGEYYAKCRWYFMPINFFLKLNLSFFVFVVISSFLFFQNIKKERQEVFYVVIPIFSILFLSMVLSLKPLVRYILPLFPFLAVIAALHVSFWQKNMTRRILFGGLLLLLVSSTFGSFPHFISYANEFAGYPDERFTLLSDSNLDWGQNLPDIATYVMDHPSTAMQLSYFGRDNGDMYGLKSNKIYGSYKEPEICAFHKIRSLETVEKAKQTLMSVSNWYDCGYFRMPEFQKQHIQRVIAGSILVF